MVGAVLKLSRLYPPRWLESRNAVHGLEHLDDRALDFSILDLATARVDGACAKAVIVERQEVASLTLPNQICLVAMHLGREADQGGLAVFLRQGADVAVPTPFFQLVQSQAQELEKGQFIPPDTIQTEVVRKEENSHFRGRGHGIPRGAGVCLR